MAKTEERDHVDDFLESIRDELPDLDFEVEGIVERIMGLSRRIKRMMEETCAEHGLTWGEWKVLGYLHRKSGPTRRASPGQLAEHLELSSGAMTNRLDRLEEAGLVERLRDPDDRRGVQVELTAAGRAGIRADDDRPGGEGSPGRLGAERAREEGPERPPAPDDDHVRGLRAGSTLMGAIQARDLVRTYKTSTGIFRRRGVEVQAVRGVSFEVADGELFGLLGPNGAGKTTTIKMLITLLIPTSGSASVLGYDVVKDAREVRKRIGYVFGGDRGLYERLSALDNLRYFAELYAVPPAEQKRRIAELLDLVGLAGREKERVEGYSRGMRQRLHIARGLLHDPPVVFLDEPTIGVDPVGARELRRTIAGLTEAGKTVLLTTHYMFEADDLCDRMAVIAKGEIVAEGTPRDLKAIVADRTVIEIETFGVDEDAVERVRQADGVTSVSIEERDQAQVLHVQSPAGTELTQPLLGLLGTTRIGRVAVREPTLEDAYVALVGRDA